jgi:hypothetical protein
MSRATPALADDQDLHTQTTTGAVAVRCRRRTQAAALAAVCVLLAGYAGGLLTPRTPGDDSPEAGFAQDMSTHHAQAVDMAMIVYPKSTDPHRPRRTHDGLPRCPVSAEPDRNHGDRTEGLAPHATDGRPPLAWMPDSAHTVTPEVLMAEAVLVLTRNRQVIDLFTGISNGERDERADLTAALAPVGCRTPRLVSSRRRRKPAERRGMSVPMRAHQGVTVRCRPACRRGGTTRSRAGYAVPR